MKMKETVPAGAAINVINAERADELIKLGFHCSEQKSGDGTIFYQFVATPKLMKILSGQFEKTDFFISKNLFL